MDNQKPNTQTTTAAPTETPGPAPSPTSATSAEFVYHRPEGYQGPAEENLEPYIRVIQKIQAHMARQGAILTPWPLEPQNRPPVERKDPVAEALAEVGDQPAYPPPP